MTSKQKFTLISDTDLIADLIHIFTEVSGQFSVFFFSSCDNNWAYVLTITK